MGKLEDEAQNIQIFRYTILGTATFLRGNDSFTAWQNITAEVVALAAPGSATACRRQACKLPRAVRIESDNVHRMHSACILIPRGVLKKTSEAAKTTFQELLQISRV